MLTSITIVDHVRFVSGHVVYADNEVIAQLPCFSPIQTYEDCLATGKWDMLSCSAAERAEQPCHSAPVLHVPGEHCYQLPADN